MAIEKRDWIMLGIGAVISFFVFSSIGRRTIMAGMGMTTAEINRALSKLEKVAERRAK